MVRGRLYEGQRSEHWKVQLLASEARRVDPPLKLSVILMQQLWRGLATRMEASDGERQVSEAQFCARASPSSAQIKLLGATLRRRFGEAGITLCLGLGEFAPSSLYRGRIRSRFPMLEDSLQARRHMRA